MVVQSPPQPPTIAPPKATEPYREPVAPGPPEDTTTAWIFLWTLFGVKLILIGVLLWVSWSEVSLVMVAASSWFWLVLPVVALAGPVAFRWRLIKQRRRAAALRRSEWLVEGDTDPEAGAANHPVDRKLG
jgi:hypothetical protein